MKITKYIPRSLFFLLAYFLFALIFTWPLIFHLSDRVVGTGDANYVIWQNWWFKKALFELHQNPLSWNNFLFYPDGYKLGNGYDGLLFPLFSLAFPLNFPAILLYNLTVLISFTLNGFCAFLLAKHLTKNNLASFFGGLAFGFSPYLLSRGWAGHANLLSAWTIPLFLIFFLRMEKNSKPINIILSALGLLLVSLASWQYLFITLFLVISIAFFRFKVEHQKLAVKPTLAFLILSVIFILPIAFPMIEGILKGETTRPLWNEYIIGSANLITYFIPPPMATFGGFLGQKIYPYIPRFNDPEAVIFPGYFELGLLVYYLWRWRKKPVPEQQSLWLFLSVVFFILSLGPVLVIFNQPVLPLPYLAFLPLPFLNLIRVPARFTVVLSLSLAVIISFWTKERLKDRGRWTAVLIIIITLILIIERGFWPFKLTTEVSSKFYQQISLDENRYAIANLPLWDANTNAPASYAQSLHRKMIVGGYVAPRAISQNTLSFITSNPLFNLSTCRNFDQTVVKKIDSTEPLNTLLAALSENKIRYIVVHKKILEEKFCQNYKEFLTDYLKPLSPYFEDEELRVYKIN